MRTPPKPFLRALPAALLLLVLCAARASAAPTAQISAAVWRVLAPGMDLGFYFPPAVPGVEVAVLRIDLAHFTVRVRYRPGEPLDRQAWQDTLPGALALVNANFFTPENTARGLVVVDGVPHEPAIEAFGAIFQIRSGHARVRSAVSEPYHGEMLEQAVQAFPMLVRDGAAAFEQISRDEQTRRTAAAHDRQGRVLLIATTFPGIRLLDLARFLADSDLDIENAVNLDGGSSTLMAFDPALSTFAIDPIYPVPSVIAVFPRESASLPQDELALPNG